MTLHPLVARFSLADIPCGARRVRTRSEEARRTLALCAERCDAPIGGWMQDPDGRPLPNDGWHWSLAHRGAWTAAVVATTPVGIDVEIIRPRPDEVFDETGGAAEWAILGGRSVDAFFRLWTAKEAVLKLRGLGMAGWDRCRVTSAPSASRLVISLEEHEYMVDGFVRGPIVAAAAFATETDVDVQWELVE